MIDRRRLRAAAAFLCAGLVAAVLGGCSVATTVSVDEPADGHGSVAVSVRLDRSALIALGGLDALRSQLSVGDLRSAGWQVAGPTPDPGGGAVVAASHPFQSDSDVAQLISEIAGPGRFRIALQTHRTFWHTYQNLTGDVDLSCGLACFGDSGLKAATGSPIGVDPVALGGASAGSVFTFSLAARLPGRLQATNAPLRHGPVLGWSPQLGRSVAVTAATRTLNQGSVVGVGVAGGALILGSGGLVGWRLVRRRRRRRRGGRGRGGSGPGDPGVAVGEVPLGGNSPT